MFSGRKRGMVLRKSVLSNFVSGVIFPVRNPLPSGLYGTKPMPSSSELAQKIAVHAPTAGEHATSIPGLTLYRRTSTTPCYPATYEPSLNIFVQGRKRITLGGTTYLCDGSTFL